MQEYKVPDRSGFRIIQLDTKQRLRRIVSYRWATSLYSVLEDSEWKPYSRSASLVDLPTPTPKFLEKLSDSGIGLTHRSRGPVPLDAVFVYPDVVISALSASDIQKEVKGDNLLKYLSETARVIIRGSPYSGKTSLAKTVVKEWLRSRSVPPLGMISGVQIKQADSAFINRLIHLTVADAYGEAAVERYSQLPPAAKALVVDDWDESRLSEAERERFLQAVMPRFGKVVLFLRSMSYIQYVLARLKGTESILQFERVSIKEFSHVARGEHIENWLRLESSNDDTGFSRRVEQTERLVQSVIGKNTSAPSPVNGARNIGGVGAEFGRPTRERFVWVPV